MSDTQTWLLETRRAEQARLVLPFLLGVGVRIARLGSVTTLTVIAQRAAASS
jgi:hypothetical protein